jgi:predicted nucleic acid-binding protein
LAQADFVKHLAPFRRVAVDTNLCIYHLEPGAARGRRSIAAHIFERAAKRALAIDLPAIVRLEMLVQPLRLRDDVAVAKVRRFAHGQGGVEPSGVTEDVIMRAAEVRAATRLRTADSLVVASALATGCGAIIGNDRAFEALNKPSESPLALPRYIHIDDFLEDA